MKYFPDFMRVKERINRFIFDGLWTEQFMCRAEDIYIYIYIALKLCMLYLLSTPQVLMYT